MRCHLFFRPKWCCSRRYQVQVDGFLPIAFVYHADVVDYDVETTEVAFRKVQRFYKKKQGYHHNGDQAARRSHTFCSICVHSFGALEKAVGLFTTSLQSQEMFFLSNMLYWQFRRTATVWMQFRRGIFRAPGWGVRGAVSEWVIV